MADGIGASHQVARPDPTRPNIFVREQGMQAGLSTYSRQVGSGGRFNSQCSSIAGGQTGEPSN